MTGASNVIPLTHGDSYIENGVRFVRDWFPEPGEHCIEPGCTALKPEDDPHGFFTCGDRQHAVSGGRRRPSRIWSVKHIEPRTADLAAALSHEAAQVAEITARLAAAECSKADRERLMLALRRIAAAARLLDHGRA